MKRKDWVEEHLERKHVNPLVLIGFLAVTIVAVLWDSLRSKVSEYITPQNVCVYLTFYLLGLVSYVALLYVLPRRNL